MLKALGEQEIMLMHVGWRLVSKLRTDIVRAILPSHQNAQCYGVGVGHFHSWMARHRHRLLNGNRHRMLDRVDHPEQVMSHIISKPVDALDLLFSNSRRNALAVFAENRHMPKEKQIGVRSRCEYVLQL